VIGLGKKSATFRIKMGTSRIDYIPKSGDPQAAAWSRFVALELVLTDLLRTSEIKGKKEKSEAPEGQSKRVGLLKRKGTSKEVRPNQPLHLTGRAVAASPTSRFCSPPRR
jgi:hypothetical protein